MGFDGKKQIGLELQNNEKNKKDERIYVSVKNINKFIDKDARKKSNEFKKASRRRRRVQRNNAALYGNMVDVLWQERIDFVKQGKYRVIHKAGPREMGRIEYHGGDEEYNGVLNDATNWLAPRLTVPHKNKKKAKPKAGPREIGRADKFVGIEYNEEEEQAKRAKKKAMIEVKKRKQFEKERLAKLERGKIVRPSSRKSSAAAAASKKKDKKSKKKNVK